jgi:hypothetical protein
MSTINFLGKQLRNTKPERESLLVRGGDGKVAGITRIRGKLTEQQILRIVAMIEDWGYHEKSDRTGLIPVYFLGGDIPDVPKKD